MTEIDAVGMAEMLKIIWLLEMKYKREAQLIPIDNDAMIRVADTDVVNMSYFAVCVYFLTLNHNVLQIEGNVSVPASIKQTDFYVRGNMNKYIFKKTLLFMILEKLENTIIIIRSILMYIIHVAMAEILTVRLLGKKEKLTM